MVFVFLVGIATIIVKNYFVLSYTAANFFP